MGLGLGLGIWWPTQTSIIPGLLKALCARATYCENKLCTTATLEEIAAVRYTAPVLPTGLLADYPGASAAYSLRNLIDTTTSVVRVRRSLDNTEQDFTATEITDGALATFCSGTDGFVAIWYDQSVNAVNAAQASASAQPQIVDNGVVILENEKPAIETSSSSFNGFAMNTQITSTNSFVVCKSRNNSESNLQVAYGNNNNTHALYTGGTNVQATGGIKQNTSTGNLQTNVDNTNQKLISVDITNQEIYINTIGSVVSGSSASSFPANVIGGRQSSGNYWYRGTYQEFIFYPTAQSSNRTGIETNINTEYTIYPTSGLLADYPGASAAYSLRNLSNTITSIVRVRRSNDNTEQDFTASEITDGTLATFCNSTNGFVTTWYDQSGNSNNAVQAAANAQPKIVSSGVVILRNGKPAALFDGVNDLLGTGYGSSQPLTIAFVGGLTNTQLATTAFYSGGPGINDRVQLYANGGLFNLYAGAAISSSVSDDTNQHLFFNLHNTTSSSISIDGSVVGTGDNGNFLLDNFQLGSQRSALSFLDGYIQEVILYPSDNSSNQVGIETNINTEYTIY